ncbi:MAG TPA: hypothetical protein VER08_05435, partial [Pyrinomonadaceae bacterium]|nr:hypothetical protein [Pyrinomonadaceae bacterium]
QDLDNLYGSPQCTDARGRTATASTCIVALGKLGSRELNYASDIDLLFLYSDDGTTAGSATLYARFAEEVRERVYRRTETVERALSHVRLARQKIDREHGRDARGFNVKLGRGGGNGRVRPAAQAASA